jgi:hypothetical protein
MFLPSAEFVRDVARFDGDVLADCESEPLFKSTECVVGGATPSVTSAIACADSVPCSVTGLWTVGRVDE